MAEVAEATEAPRRRRRRSPPRPAPSSEEPATREHTAQQPAVDARPAPVQQHAAGQPASADATRAGPRRRRRRGGRGQRSAEPAAREQAHDAPTPAPEPERPAGKPEREEDDRPGRFGEMTLAGPVARAIADMGYVEPSPIQVEAIPALQAGRDLVGQAITGSGKTAAFGIPICERVDPSTGDIEAIVLVPTRELAMQVTGEIERIGARRGVRVCAVFGGQPIKRQLDRLARGVDVVVGTPGRVMDHMGRGTIDLGRVKIAVLDEADEMLDIGFAKDMEYILRHTPRSRQTMLFSATIPGFVGRLIRRYQDDPVWVRIGAEIQTVDEVDQIYYEVAERDKERAMREVLEELDEGSRVLVFRRMQIGVDRLVRSLHRDYPVMGLHGGMSQPERDAAMGKFKEGSLPILVSTNVAARGIDVREISHVVNYDMPGNVEEYVHRIGRTARMGRKGTAVSFVAEWDLEIFERIIHHIGDERLTRRQLSIY